MTDSQLTQCPHCKASFKVSEEQLGVANGRVRCGACLNVFDAIAYRISAPLIEEDDEDFNRKIAGFDEHLEDSIDLENELLIERPESTTPANDQPDEELFDETLFADDPEEDKLEKGYTGSNKFSDDLSSSFLALEKSSGTPFAAESLDDQVIDPSDPDKDSVDESWAASILDDLDEPGSHKIEPSISGTSAFEHKKTDPNLTLDDQAVTTDSSTRIKASASKTLSETDFSANELSPKDALDFDKNDLNTLNFQYEQDSPGKLKWLGWSVFALINLCLLLALIAQVSWYHYEKLVKYPKIAAAYEFVCQQFSCSLPELRDLSKIENRNLVVKSHPTVFKALIIETIITNQANFDQAFPSISLSFSDINNNVIAQRLFTPAEYLSQEVHSWPAMPSKQPIQITLEIIDPGPQAVNYTIDFYAESEAVDGQKNDQMSTNKSKI